MMSFWCFFAGWVLLGFGLATPSAVLAGGGALDPQSGQMRLDVAFRDSPGYREVAEAQAALSRMASVLCDATEGAVRVKEIRLTTSPADEELAAFWLHGENARSGGPYQPDGSSLRRLGSHFDVFLGSRLRPDHLAHMIGHHAFGLGDQYDEQRRRGENCGIGHGFERGALDEQNHSLMQGAGRMACVSGADDGAACLLDADCPGASCEAVLMSEFSVPGNHDSVDGSGKVCPRPAGTSRIGLKGLLPRSAQPVTDFDATDFLTAAATSSRMFPVEIVVGPELRTSLELRLYLTHRAPLTWLLSAVMDASAFGGPAGRPRLLETWVLHFNEDRSLKHTSESPLTLELEGLAVGGAPQPIAIDVGTPNADAFNQPGLGFDGLQMTKAGDLNIDLTFDGIAGCGADFCEKAWNSNTQRWETTEQTLLHGESDWQTMARNHPFLSVPGGLPRPDLEPACQQTPDFVSNVAGLDQILLVLDTSASTGEAASSRIAEICSNDTDDDGDAEVDEEACSDTRLDFALAAGRALTVLLQDEGVELGVLGFGEHTNLIAPLQLLTAHRSEAVRAALGRIEPSGNTSLGMGLHNAYEVFDRAAGQGRSRMAVLLSDGNNNAGIEPGEAGRSLGGRRLRWFTVPVGRGADEPLMARMARDSGGVMFSAQEVSDLPAAVAEIAARVEGNSLVLPRTRFTLWRGEPKNLVADGRSVREGRRAEIEIPVEEGAEELVVFLTGGEDSASRWRVLFDLIGPAGERIDPDSGRAHTDDYFSVIRVPDPRPGTWRLRVVPWGGDRRRGQALAWVESDRADLFADVRPRMTAPDRPVVVTANPVYGVNIEGEVELAAEVVRPDGSRRKLAFERNRFTRGWRAEFNDYVGRGRYEVRVTARVGAAAHPILGESIFGGPEDAGVRVVPFRRTTTASFFVESGAFPACSNDDCDHDDISNRVESRCGRDSDGDGVPNRYDVDSDDDEISDRKEGVEDSDGDGLPDFCDPEGAPSDLVRILEDDRRAKKFACSAQSEDSVEALESSLIAHRRLLQTLRTRDVDTGPRADAPVLAGLEEALATKKRAYIVADVLPDFCESFEESLTEAIAIEDRLAEDVRLLLVVKEPESKEESGKRR